ncbi:receptor-type tyrosine-protein phosphatase epsilon-like [Haliotis rufescens]|uniref:receptor-type tyrosine-protein phosphatase epsilon-like n=1 Tax=Haliotis rufescens TaxID=6454 RepID=UPI00201F26D4|nr:receptor-type tyrosine-protein phosphatase epsilon-like [Haliotis rufescens]
MTGACSSGQCQTGWAGTDCAACSVGIYGVNCNKNCNSRHCSGSPDSCDSMTGACSSGQCQTGWAGTDCAACSVGIYGVNCNKNCNSRHCSGSPDSCDSMTGLCSSGQCQTGWAGTDCAACSVGIYGVNCNKNCNSRRCSGSPDSCDSMTGACPGGQCQTGWAGTDCAACSVGIYGVNCNKNCNSRHCSGSPDSCDSMTGACSSGQCQTGWAGTDCAGCDNGKFGLNCESDCGHCNGTCDGVDGRCLWGCTEGYNGSHCSVKFSCDNGKFGLNCESDCGHCNGTCDGVDGRCLWGCTEGYNGSRCSVKFTRLNGKDTPEFPGSAVVGTVAGVFVAIIIVVVVVVVIRRRQRFLDSNSNEQIAEFHPKAQEDGTYENVTLDDRNAVNQKPLIKPKPATQASSDKQHKSNDKDQEEEDFDEDVQSPESCYYNADADAAIRDVAVSELAATVATLKDRTDGFEKEYHRLPTGFTAPYRDSQKPENNGKNKFRGYYPYDHNRVRLASFPDTPGSDYINASLMHSYNQRKTYIASQAPNKKTVGDFWRMIWEQSCSHVVMLTGLMEECRIKCERYWPTGGVMDIGLFKIEVEVTQSRANFTTRHMKVTSNTTGECRSVVQFHFTSWPDHGVPDTLALVNYIWLVRETVAETDGPLLVHCSAGIGRTGTYIAVDSLLDQARGEGVVDVLGYVSVMRGQRKNMIQTPAQYECVFLSLVEMTKYGCTSMDVSNYTNSYSCSGMDTTMDGKTFRQMSEILESEAREDAPTRHRMWVDGNPDFIVRVGPSLTCLRGYLQATAPPPGLVKLLWKLVEENDVHNIIVVTPDMGLVQAEGRSKTHGEITVTTTSQTSLSTDLTMNNLQLATKAGRPRQVKMVDVNANLTMEVMTSHLLNHAQLQETSTQPHPVVIVHSENDQKLAVSFCIMGNILSGIREDTRVDVIGHMRTFLRCCPDLQFTQSDVQMFHDFAQQCILRTDPANTYANT